jgi:hypothetical protein
VGSAGALPARGPPPLRRAASPGWSERAGKDTVSPRARGRGRLTQRQECLPYKEEVGGSNPPSPTPPSAPRARSSRGPEPLHPRNGARPGAEQKRARRLRMLRMEGTHRLRPCLEAPERRPGVSLGRSGPLLAGPCAGGGTPIRNRPKAPAVATGSARGRSAAARPREGSAARIALPRGTRGRGVALRSPGRDNRTGPASRRPPHDVQAAALAAGRSVRTTARGAHGPEARRRAGWSSPGGRA